MKISRFKEDVSSVQLPNTFTFPFYYQPNELAVIASKELQDYLTENKHWNSYFGLNVPDFNTGKMFGVLVVKDADGKLGYLSAFSGKLDDSNHHDRFVPPVFDMLKKDGFFLKEEEVINQINAIIAKLEASQDYKNALDKLKGYQTQSTKAIEEHRSLMIEARKARKQKRIQSEKENSPEVHEGLMQELAKESVGLKYQLKTMTKEWNTLIEEQETICQKHKKEIDLLKAERKHLSSTLQAKLFASYQFLNQKGEVKNLQEIFTAYDVVPPAGSGECAAPKLLHYAYKNGLKPIALAEFWWGKSPKSAIRKHTQYYPACRGKCEPILSHMLIGLDVDENPMLTNPGEHLVLETIYEDEDIVVVNKPSDLLSVPGKTIKDSVYTRIKNQYPEATGPLIIHRLDMSTSGILILAKTKEAHKFIQYQFIRKYIQKRYIALLDGEFEGESGYIELPLRVDLDDRPRQLVCFEHGKPAKTKWEVLSRENGKTLIQFYPITGRTHQLRIHAAHPKGLNTPIVGDDLYGTKTNRLHLHAEYIEFKHPRTKEMVSFQVDPAF